MSTPSIAALQRAIQISEQIEELQSELAALLGAGGSSSGNPVPKKVAVKGQKKRGGVSAEGRARIAAAQRARWAKQKGAAGQATAVATGGRKKRKLSPGARARIVAAVKARWAKQRAK